MGADDLVQRVRDALEEMIPEERTAFFFQISADYCTACGYLLPANNVCFCENDE